MSDTLSQGSSAYGVRLTPTQLERFEAYTSLLAEWSNRMNLVADADQSVIERRHILESIALGAALREREVLRPDSKVLDVGAGAGFPGAVWKVVWPAIRLTLLEATEKKAAFLRALVEALAFDDTPVLSGRAETFAHDPELRGSFDLVVARAVAPLPVLLELTLPFARIGGRVVTPKGSRAEADIAASARALSVLGGKIFTAPLSIPGPTQTLVAVIKQRETPREYPRRPGLPAKWPL